MDEGDVQSVLRCEQCNKPFDKESTLKRHGYYCRSGRVGRTPRSRSCINCARAKARCDNKWPNCSRCVTKAMGCHYPANTAKSIGPRYQRRDDAPIERRDRASSVVVDSASVDNHQGSNHDDLVLESAPIIPDSGFVGLEGGYLDWDVSDIDFADFLNPQTNEEAAQYPSLGSPSLVYHSTSSIDQTDQREQAISSPKVSIPPRPSLYVRSLLHRPKTKTGTPQRVANLMLHTLKSYPQMMLRHKALPPFIHPYLVSSEFENDHMEPLTNCMSLMHMISSGVKGSRKLFWRNVHQECERFCAETMKLNRWGLLSAMQALSIYILVRLDEGETEHNNCDFLLQATMVAIAKQLICHDSTCNTPSALCSYGSDPSWLDWIYEESRRRLGVVYRVVGMLVYFESMAMCELQKDLVLAPLPGKKELWEASDEFVWKTKSERDPRLQDAFALAATGDLVKLDEGQLHCTDAVLRYKPIDARTPSRSAAYWEEWCSGMDGFGGLVMLAASLIE